MRNAFAHIEIMIVISIIATIAGIIIPILMEKDPAYTIIQINGRSYTAHKFILEGHSYFMIGGGVQTLLPFTIPNVRSASPLL